MKISVIVPVYNAEKYLREALDSVLAQTYSDWECICVDDGSTDGSDAILGEYAAADLRIQVCHQSNAGVSVARNKGMRLASGEYICFMDADDTVDVDWLQNYADAIVKYPDVDVIRLKRPWWNVVPGVVELNRLQCWKWREWVREGFPWSYAIRREIACRVEFPEGVAMGEDALYVARVSRFVFRAVQLTICGYWHRVDPQSAMFRKLKSRERLAYLRAIEDLVDSDSEVDGHEISRMVGDAVIAWAVRPADMTCREEIRHQWKRLASWGMAQVSSVSGRDRLVYWLYAQTGLIFPIKVWAWGVQVLVRLKRGGCS